MASESPGRFWLLGYDLDLPDSNGRELLVGGPYPATASAVDAGRALVAEFCNVSTAEVYLTRNWWSGPSGREWGLVFTVKPARPMALERLYGLKVLYEAHNDGPPAF